MAHDSHPVRNGIIATVVGGAILSLLLDPVRDAVVAVARWVWSLLVAICALAVDSYALPGWLLLIVFALAVIPIVQVIRTIVAETVEQPEHLSYVEDQMHGAVWRWRWAGNHMTDIRGFCPYCDGELVYNDSSCRSVLAENQKTDFICENCQTVRATISGGPLRYAIAAVEREILRRIRTRSRE